MVHGAGCAVGTAAEASPNLIIMRICALV
eukprot:SAG31_NODE_44044_length_264_cov_0.945455_1_plen_28_part_10